MPELVAPPRDAVLQTISPRFVVADLTQALAFYAQLGFQPTYHDDGFAIIERDGIALHLNCFPEHHGPHAVCWIGVHNITALYQAYLPTHAITGPLTAQPYGLTEFCVCDPFRNLLIFAEPTAAGGGAVPAED